MRWVEIERKVPVRLTACRWMKVDGKPDWIHERFADSYWVYIEGVGQRGVQDGDWIIAEDGVIIDVVPNEHMFHQYQVTKRGMFLSTLEGLFDESADLRERDDGPGQQEPG